MPNFLRECLVLKSWINRSNYSPVCLWIGSIFAWSTEFRWFSETNMKPLKCPTVPQFEKQHTLSFLAFSPLLLISARCFNCHLLQSWYEIEIESANIAITKKCCQWTAQSSDRQYLVRMRCRDNPPTPCMPSPPRLLVATWRRCDGREIEMSTGMHRRRLCFNLLSCLFVSLFQNETVALEQLPTLKGASMKPDHLLLTWNYGREKLPVIITTCKFF